MAHLDYDGLIRRHLEAANHNDFDTMDELFAEDYTLELPQSGERIKGKAKIRDLHINYPAKVHFVTRRVIGFGELAV
jgi:ketosteroid isomerase-like protein